jgi:hypothetical protein
MSGRLGTTTDILMTESVLSRLLELMDSMLLDTPMAGVVLSGIREHDDNGEYTVVEGIDGPEAVGICIGSSEGGTVPSDEDVGMLKNRMQQGILMKVDVFAHQFSFYKISDEIEDATVLFVE